MNSVYIEDAKSSAQTHWDWEVQADKTSWKLNFKNLFSYKHLVFSIVRKDFLLNYQQTLIGPAWILIQPLLTLCIYMLVFSRLIGVAKSETVPMVLFYFSGIILWNFFNESFGAISKTFINNIHIFSKVYFPRIIIPVASLFTSLIRFLIQFALLLVLLLYHFLFENFSVDYNAFTLLFLPVIILVATFSFSIGLIFSVITAKYRDISNIVDLGIRLLFFITPIFYPLTSVPVENHWILQLNPLTPLFELFRLCLLGEGSVVLKDLFYPVIFISSSFFLSLYLFNKNGKKLIDVI